MSIHRLCDCPDCHGYDELSSAIVDDDYVILDGKDICGACLRGEWGCTYWQVRVLPPLIPGIHSSIWDKQVLASLRPYALLKDYDTWKTAEITFIKHKKERDAKHAG